MALALLLFCACVLRAAAEPCSSAIAGLVSTLASETRALAAAAAAAEASGIDVTLETQTLAIANLYLSVVVPADVTNASTSGVGAAYASWLTVKEHRSPAFIAAEVALLPCNETTSALLAVRAASAALAAVVLAPSTRPHVPSSSLLATGADWSARDGLLHANAAHGGGVVYAASYCWALCPLAFPDAQLPQVTAIPHAHTMHYEWVALSDTLLPGPDEGVNLTEVERIVASAARYEAMHGLRTHMFMDQRFVPSWAAHAYPGIDDVGGNHNVAFNIDHPAVWTALWGPVLNALMPRLRVAMPRAPLSYLVCNECFFTSPPANNVSLTAFQTFLKSVYDGNMSALDESWGIRLKQWTGIDEYPSAPRPPRSGERSLGYTPTHPRAAWWDYTQFCRWRTNRFFASFAAAIRAFDPGAMLHHKTMNEPFYGNDGADGLDRDEMGRTLGIVGADTRGTQSDSLPAGTGSQFFDPFFVRGRYAWDWRGMGLCYPLMRAFGRVPPAARDAASGVQALLSRGGAPLPPTAWAQMPAFDSETHEQSTAMQRTHESRPEHAEAAAWLLHMGGIALHSLWFWGRALDGSVASPTWPTTGRNLLRLGALGGNIATSTTDARNQLLAASGSDFAYSYTTAPSSIDAAARAQAAINSVADSIAALATGADTPSLHPSVPASAARGICSLFSLPSRVHSAHANLTSGVASLVLLEAAAFYGAHALDYVTERQALEAGGDAFDGCAVVLLPALGYCADATVAALSAWVTAGDGKRIIAVPPEGAGTHPPLPSQLACGADEYARSRDPASLSFLSHAQWLTITDARVLFFDALEPALVAAGVPRLVRCVVAGSSGDPAHATTAFGVLSRWVLESGGTTLLVWLHNVTPSPINVTLSWDTALGGTWVASARDVLSGVIVPLGVTGVPLPSEGVGRFLRVTLPTA